MQAEEWQSETQDLDVSKTDSYLKRMDRDIGVLHSGIKSKESEFEACKAKFVKLVNEYAAVNDATEQTRTEFNLNLKLLQQSKPKNMVPLYDTHLSMVTSFFNEQVQATDVLSGQLEALLNEINIPEFRYLNVQTSLQELGNLKNTLLKDYSACRDEIQQVEDSQIRLNNKFASMSDFNAIPLSLRTDCLASFKQSIGKLRKLYSSAYLKNTRLVSNTNKCSDDHI